MTNDSCPNCMSHLSHLVEKEILDMGGKIVIEGTCRQCGMEIVVAANVEEVHLKY